MPEDFIQVAPDSTGAKIRTRTRTIGANTVEEQYVIVQPEAVAINRVWSNSLRIPYPLTAAAITAGTNTPIWSLWNGIASGGNSVSVRRLTMEVDTATAHAVLSPIARLYRMTTAGSGNTAITPVQQYTADTAFSGSVVVRANHAAEAAAGTLALGTLGAAPMWSQTLPRMQVSGAAFSWPTELNLLPNDSQLMAQDPLIVRPQEGFAIQMYAPAAVAATAGIWNITVKAVLAEFTYP